MIIQLLAKGFLIGFLASMPLGPISVLIIQRSINRSRWSGFFSGIGAAVSDSLYATIAGLSMALVIGFIESNASIFRILGSVVLLLLGVFIFRSHPERFAEKNGKKQKNHFQELIATFLVTVSNPMVIFLHLAIFSGFGIVLSISEPWMASFFMFGFFLGAVAWWFSLSSIIYLFRKRFTLQVCLWFNRLAGIGIVLFVLVSFILSHIQ